MLLRGAQNSKVLVQDDGVDSSGARAVIVDGVGKASLSVVVSAKVQGWRDDLRGR
jgi:hypothetical protein